MLSQEYVLLHETPRADEYRLLRVDAGLSPKSAEGAALGLPNTLYAVTIRQSEALVGMGRVVGDGGLAFLVVDIAVHPEHQGKGLGKKIVGALTAWLRSNAPKGAHVSLIADGPAKHLYAKFGFRETGPDAVGMDLLLEGKV